ncbi:MAG TPA: hypothetical protein VIH72_11750 [Candidatus Acidoferrales bacterium]
MAVASDDIRFSDFVRGSERIGIRQYAMLLECYFDDSSDDKRENYVAFGGLIGAASQWDAQLIGWGNASYGLKEPFRSTDCETGHGQFEGIEIPERVARMANMVDVIHATELRGFASIVPVGLYRELFPKSKPSDPSLLALRQAIMNMAYIAHDLEMDVQIWFEKGNQDEEIKRTFDSIAKYAAWRPTARLRSIAFDTKRSAHLQAADLVAREAFKHIANKGIRPTRIPVSRLSDRLAFVLWNRQTLEFLAENGGPENIQVLADWDYMERSPKFGWFVIDKTRKNMDHEE